MRVAVAMSGGMDSTATALLLKKRGFDPLGLHMLLHEHSDETWEDARRVAQWIGIPIEPVDLRREFSELVVGPFVREYARGRTPSPCPLCNRQVKVARLLEAARSVGCDKLATGHYARIDRARDGPALQMGMDRNKDQSYFLFTLEREVLSDLLLPLGEFTKTRVRNVLRQEGLAVVDNDESQELCFIPDGDYRSFLKRHGVFPRSGPILDTAGNRLGHHKGITEYTVGQRRGLGVVHSEPLYVLRIDPETNALVVGVRSETYAEGLTASCVTFLTATPPEAGAHLRVKVRSTAPAVPCMIKSRGPDAMDIQFGQPQSSVAPGQAAVLYRGERVIGGGWIESAW